MIYEAYDKSWKPTQTLGGKQDGIWKTMEAKEYPILLCKILAMAHQNHARELIAEGEEASPVGLDDAIQALCGHFDPFLRDAKGSVMLHDYNKNSNFDFPSTDWRDRDDNGLDFQQDFVVT